MHNLKYLDSYEVVTLVKTCSQGLKALDRNSVMIYTALRCGLRAQELLNLTLQDLDFDHRTVRVQTLKRGQPRTVPAPDALFAYAQTVTGTKIFPISYPRLVQIWDIFRPSRKKFHSLRHTFALEVYRRRKDINLVKHVLGHKSLSSTTVYLDEAYSLTELKSAFGL